MLLPKGPTKPKQTVPLLVATAPSSGSNRPNSAPAPLPGGWRHGTWPPSRSASAEALRTSKDRRIEGSREEHPDLGHVVLPFVQGIGVRFSPNKFVFSSFLVFFFFGGVEVKGNQKEPKGKPQFWRGAPSKKTPASGIWGLWMDEVLHHLRNHG